MILGHHVHALLRKDHLRRSYGLCGKRARRSTKDPKNVTCERCLASLAKADREFRAKARAQFRSYMTHSIRWSDEARAAWYRAHSANAARAIAAEEGRSKD